MTDREFEIMDELYFVQTFDALLEATKLPESELKQGLNQLIDKGWAKCLNSLTVEVGAEVTDFETKYRNYYYLATKAGLLAHNSI